MRSRVHEGERQNSVVSFCSTEASRDVYAVFLFRQIWLYLPEIEIWQNNRRNPTDVF